MPVAQDEGLLVPEGIPELLRDLIHERLGTYFDESRFDTMLDKLEEPARALSARPSSQRSRRSSPSSRQ